MASLNSDAFALPELIRIKGELIVKKSDSPPSGYPQTDSTSHVSNEVSATLLQAEACFAEALAIAEQQGTRSWELRAALSMDRLQSRLGKSDHLQLAEVYSSFTEGQETADLKQAGSRLDTATLA